MAWNQIPYWFLFIQKECISCSFGQSINFKKWKFYHSNDVSKTRDSLCHIRFFFLDFITSCLFLLLFPTEGLTQHLLCYAITKNTFFISFRCIYILYMRVFIINYNYFYSFTNEHWTRTEIFFWWVTKSSVGHFASFILKVKSGNVSSAKSSLTQLKSAQTSTKDRSNEGVWKCLTAARKLKERINCCILHIIHTVCFYCCLHYCCMLTQNCAFSVWLEAGLVLKL